MVLRILLVGAVCAVLRGQGVGMPAEALQENDECIGGGEEGACSVSALQLHAAAKRAGCGDCADGCLDAEGKCKKDEEVEDCFKGAEQGQAFTICTEEGAVRLQTKLSTPAADACSECSGGCATPDGCLTPEDGTAASLRDCIGMAVDADNATFCGASPQFITFEEEETSVSFAQRRRRPHHHRRRRRPYYYYR